MVIEVISINIGLCIVVPITDSGTKKSKIFVRVIDQQHSGLTKPSVIDTYQIRAIDKSRITKRLGKVDDVTFSKVLINLALIIGIDTSHVK